MQRIGLLGGTSWESTVHYYRLLNEGARARLGAQHSADLLLRSLPFDRVCALQEAEDWAALGEWYAAEAATLAAAGAQVLGICANTMHLVHDDVVRGSGLPVVHVVDAVAAAARAAGVGRVALLGTRYTMASDLYPARMTDIDVLVPTGADAAEVNRIIYAELVQGVVLDSSRQTMLDVLARLVDRGAQAVVLGCTELSMVLDPADPALPVPALDSLALHVDALLEAALAVPDVSVESPATLERGAA